MGPMTPTQVEEYGGGPVKMPRPIAFDITHVVSRLPITKPSGIDKVDLAFVAHFAQSPCDIAVHYGVSHPRIHAGTAIASLYEQARTHRWSDDHRRDDDALARVSVFLCGGTVDRVCLKNTACSGGGGWFRRWTQISWRLARSATRLPRGSIYLNAAQHAFEYPQFFAWLGQRPDIKPVFLVHDLLPLDYPEYFRPGYKERFARRLATITRYAAGLIVTSNAVAERVSRAYADSDRAMVPCHVAPLPSSLPVPEKNLAAAKFQSAPYFVVIGTIEPRKNHLLLLNIWRRLAEEQPRPPKLIIVGARGWENEQILDVLDRSALVRPHVLEISGLSDRALAQLIAHARGLLMPSFAEGYGLPVVEALAAGTPVIASDIPVFREISQGRALFRHPLDGLGWRTAIQELVDMESATSLEIRTRTSEFRSPTWDGYFRDLRGFLSQL